MFGSNKVIISALVLLVAADSSLSQHHGRGGGRFPQKWERGPQRYGDVALTPVNNAQQNPWSNHFQQQQQKNDSIVVQLLQCRPSFQGFPTAFQAIINACSNQIYGQSGHASELCFDLCLLLAANFVKINPFDSGYIIHANAVNHVGTELYSDATQVQGFVQDFAFCFTNSYPKPFFQIHEQCAHFRGFEYCFSRQLLNGCAPPVQPSPQPQPMPVKPVQPQPVQPQPIQPQPVQPIQPQPVQPAENGGNPPLPVAPQQG